MSLLGFGAVTDSAATEFTPTALMTDLSSMALNSREQGPSFPEPRTYDNITNWQYKQNSPFIWNSAESRSLPRQKTKRKQILSKLKVNSRINGSMKQCLSSQDLLFLSVQLLTKQKLFGFAKPSLLGFEMFRSSKISTLPSAFFHLQDTQTYVWKKALAALVMKSSSKCKPIFGYNSSPLLSFTHFHQLFLVPALVFAETNT